MKPGALESPRVAFVTPSYPGDLDRFALLCKSMDAFVSGDWHHYVIVNKQDIHQFTGFAGPNRTILQTHEIVPNGMRYLFKLAFANGRSLWWSRKTGLFIGWHMQQIIKVAMAFKLSEPIMACCDSDMFFVRPFDAADLTQNGKVRFYKSWTDSADVESYNTKYMKAGEQILGLAEMLGEKHPTYIDNFVTWHRDTVIGMCAEIELRTSQSWHVPIGKRIHISEYALYGLFVERTQKENNHVFPDATRLCKTLWFKPESDFDLQAFCNDLLPGQVAVGVQSFAGVRVDRLAAQLDAAIGIHAHRPEKN